MDEDKAYLFPRIIAYIIDIILISTVISFLTLPFNNKNINNLSKEYEEASEKLINQEITPENFINQSTDILYDLNYNMIPINIINLAGIIIYFVIFQYHNNGQTIGKKIMKIKIISNNENELNINNYVYRSFILNGLLVGILDIILILFMKKEFYFYLSFTLQFIQSVLILITILMILFRKDGRGLHDKVGNTKVIMCCEEE